ncbi:hypothetical protein BB560_000299 [Smittium megazygosporum]|uniref:Clathrin light chain n=1 Tax=Smittium megazygosporum TaxID=133381 RepID=A0A2T9ZKS6_9FUNG|nr:hypothetical protein BB560_000299 [Smittium megazygosporum]
MADEHEQHILKMERELLGEEATRFQSPTLSTPSSNLMHQDIETPENLSANSAQFFDHQSSMSPNADASMIIEEPSPFENENLIQSFQSMSSPSQSKIDSAHLQSQYEQIVDSEFLDSWKANIASIIEERDQHSQEKTRQVLEEAKLALDKFYQEANQEFTGQNFISGTFWQQVQHQIQLSNESLTTLKNLINPDSSQSASGKTSYGSFFMEPSHSSATARSVQNQAPEHDIGNVSMNNLISSLASDPFSTDPYIPT